MNSATRRKSKWVLFQKLWMAAQKKPGYDIATWKRLRDILAAEDEDVERLQRKADLLFGNGRFAKKEEAV